jgi:aminoglycoside phosphotransferase (APT) family kinase protein
VPDRRDSDLGSRLERFIADVEPDATAITVEGLSKVPMGHSAETHLFALSWREAGAERRAELVLRIRPPAPGLLEPYDLERQFRILRALEPTPVRSPGAWWYSGDPAVLGAEFYVMERLAGTVYERGVPDQLKADVAKLRRMSRSIVEAIASIHLVDLDRAELAFLERGDALERELGHWSSEIARVRKGPTPALDRLLTELRHQRPERGSPLRLVHGDPKPGNFAFADDGEVSGVFDWELSALGDPLADLGWAEINWVTPNAVTGQPGAISADEMVTYYEELTGIEVHSRPWYRAFQSYKIAAILLVGLMLFDDGFTEDARMAVMGGYVSHYTQMALDDLGVAGDAEHGAVSLSPAGAARLEEHG